MTCTTPFFRRIAPTAGFLALLTALPCQAQPADLESWHAATSPHFVVYTDASPARSEEVVLSLERFRAVFAQLAPSIGLVSPAPTKILAFKDAASYAPYKTVADRGRSRILGQFLSHPDGNYLTLDAGTRAVGAFAVIYHEYVHYFVRHNFPTVPRWFNEGLAEYYSTFTIEGGKAFLGRPVERHVDWLQQRGDFSLGEVLQADRKWLHEAHGGQGIGRFYAVSWALVHYLLSGSPERLERTADFFLRLEVGEDPEEAFEEAFDIRLGALEDELERYVQAGDFPEASISLDALPVGRVRAWEMDPADVLFHLGDLLVHMGRDAEAERHFQLALDFAPSHAESHAGLALVRDHQQRFDEAEILFRDALRLGSSDPLTYLLYGRHLLSYRPEVEPQGGEGEEAPAPSRAELARDVLRRVVELDDDYAEGWALLGRAHLQGELDPADGVAALERARKLLPDRMDLVFHQAQLHVRARQPDRADALVEGVLAVRAEAEMVERARNEIARLKLVQAAADAFEENEIDEALALYDRAISATEDPLLRQRMEEQLLVLQERLGRR